MKRHHLYEVDLEQLTAFCAVCGYTEIVLQKTRSNKKPKPLCIVRAQEMRENGFKNRNWCVMKGRHFKTGNNVMSYPK